MAEALDRGGVSVDRIAFGPPINQGPAGYRIGVSQSGGVAAPLHNRRLATEICFASILRKSPGEHISASLPQKAAGLL